MAYTIISQNNTTTTLQDENGNIIYVPGRVTLATSTDYTITEVNNNTATLTDGSGKVIRDVPCVVVLAGGGGGSDPHNLGFYADLTALQTAHPTGADGDFAILGSTDTVWVWDSDTTAWKDTDTKGQVTSVNGQTGAVTVDALPSQTGQSGKFLTTDGTDASWSDKPLVNKAVREDSLAIVGSAGQYSYNATVFGIGAQATTNGIAIGKNANAWGYVQTLGQGTNTVAIGNDVTVRMYVGSSKGVGILGNVTGGGSGRGCVAICGNITNGTTSDTGLIAIGGDTSVAGHAIQLGDGNNSTANTMQVWSYKLLDKTDGTIPTARLTKVNSTITLAAADWSSNTQTVTVNGVTSTSVVFVAPDPADTTNYVSAGILCTSQTTNSLTFTATTTPTSDIVVNVVCL